MSSQWEIKELREELDRRLFKLGRKLLGNGGMVAKLKQVRGEDGAFNALVDAIGKDSPKEYIGAVLREKPTVATTKYTEAEIELARARYYERRRREGWL